MVAINYLAAATVTLDASLDKSIALIISRAGTPAARPLRVVTTAGDLHRHARLVIRLCSC
ncbi:hypothetical protein HZB03_01800, partial [Candidatus Woesearchaeota archaeon]|nr:hypothetical protein [Candidatus Woesearchaeota archaeon]